MAIFNSWNAPPAMERNHQQQRRQFPFASEVPVQGKLRRLLGPIASFSAVFFRELSARGWKTPWVVHLFIDITWHYCMISKYHVIRSNKYDHCHHDYSTWSLNMTLPLCRKKWRVSYPKKKQPNAAAVRTWPGRRRSSRLPSGTHPRASQKSWSCPAGKSSPSWAMTHGLETMSRAQKMKHQKQQDQATPGFINQHACLYIYNYIYMPVYCIYICLILILYLYITSYVLIIIYNIWLYFYGA